ncbi:MAG: DUF4232 domain-containing protein [Marmoricola sp.]
MAVAGAGACLAAVAVGVTGCGGATRAASGPSAPATPRGSAASSSPTSSPAPPSAPSAPTSAAAGSAAGSTASGTRTSAAGCRTADLRGSLSGAAGAAGTTYYRLSLTNDGDAPCALGGYGGVSFVGAAGRQIGAPARRDAGQSGPRLLVLQPGDSAVARLGVAEAGNYDADRCRPTTARGLRVYPPNETASLFVPHPFEACASSQVQLLSLRPYRLPA